MIIIFFSLEFIQPNSTIHISYVPSYFNAEQVRSSLVDLGAAEPVQIRLIGKPDKKSALIEFHSISTAAEAIMKANCMDLVDKSMHSQNFRSFKIDFSSTQIRND